MEFLEVVEVGTFLGFDLDLVFLESAVNLVELVEFGDVVILAVFDLVFEEIGNSVMTSGEVGTDLVEQLVVLELGVES